MDQPNMDGDKIKVSFKFVFFDMLYNIINLDGLSMPLYSLFVIIETLQTFQRFFNDYFLGNWKVKNVSQPLANFFGYFMFVSYFKNSGSFNGLVTFMYAILISLFLIVMCMIYTAYTLQRRQQGMIGPLTIIKFILDIMHPVLYFPCIEVFMSFYHCSDVDGTSMHDYFPDVVCYKSIYILHLLFASIGAIFLFILTYMILITNVEQRYKPSQIQSKLSGKQDVLILVFKTVFVVSDTFLGKNLYLLTYIFFFMLQIAIFSEFNKNSNYQNYLWSKILNIQSGITMWTVFMVIFCKIVKDTDYSGAPYIWIIGIPAIIIIVSLRKEYRYDLLMINPNKFDSLEIALEKLNYETKMLNFYYSDQNIGSLLDGLVEYHQTYCTQENCPVNTRVIQQKKVKKFINNVGKYINDDLITDKYVILVLLIEKTYVMALTRFPRSIELRINHALFLLDKMKSNQLAIQELALAEQEKLFIDEQFMIYRYKKIIEQEMLEREKNPVQNKNNNQELNNDITIEGNTKEFYNNIERSTLNYIEFWSLLKEDIPDLLKLHQIGLRLNISLFILQENWKKIIRVSSDISPNIMRIYSQFLTEVVNDKESASDVLRRLQINYNQTQERIKRCNNLNDFQNESIGLISISGEENSFCKIIGINQTAASYFGYTKIELLNRKINVLMPLCISDLHDGFIESFLHVLEGNYLNMDRNLMGLKKNGYIFQHYNYTRYVPSFIHGTQFIASLKIDKCFKQIAYMIVKAKNLEILNVTQSINRFLKFLDCIQLFGLSQQYLMKNKILIDSFIPDFRHVKQEFEVKGGCVQQVSFNIKDDKKVQEQYNIYVKGDNLRKKNVSIYIVKFEKLFRQISSQNITFDDLNKQPEDYNQKIANNLIETNQTKDDKKFKQNKEKIIFSNPVFTFRYDCLDNNYIGEYLASAPIININNSIAIDNTVDISQWHNSEAVAIVSNRQTILDAIIQTDKQNELKTVVHEQINYGEGIRTLRLVANAFVDVEDFNQNQDEENDEYDSSVQQLEKNNQQEQIKQINLDEGEIQSTIMNKQNIYKSKKYFKEFIENGNSSQIPLMRIIKIAGVIFFLAIIAIAIYECINYQTQVNQIYDQNKLVMYSSMRSSLVQRIFYKLENYKILNFQLQPFPSEIVMRLNRNELGAIIRQLEDIFWKLQNHNINVDQEQQFTKNVIRYKILESTGEITENQADINQITNQLISKAYLLVNQPPTVFTQANGDLFFIEYACLNEFYYALQNATNYYQEQAHQTIQQVGINLLVVIIIGIINLCAIIFIMPIFIYVMNNQKLLLKLFLEINKVDVKHFLNKSEFFSTSIFMFFYQLALAVGDDDRGSEQEMMMENEHDNEDNLLGRRKKRKYKYESKERKLFIFKFFILIILIQAYFIITLNLQNSINTQLELLHMQLTSEVLPHSFIQYVNNALRMNFLDENFPVSQTSQNQWMDDIVTQLYDQQANIRDQAFNELSTDFQDYKDFFVQLRNIDACQVAQDNNIVLLQNCYNFAGGILKEGLTVGLVRHFENIRSVITLYQRLKNNTIPFPYKNIFITVPEMTIRQQRFANLINLNESMEISQMQDTYIRPLNELQTQKLLDSIQSWIQQFITIYITIVVSFIIILILLYIGFWLQQIIEINQKIKTTSLMLTLIPLNIMSKNIAIKDFLNKFLKIEQQ